MPDAAFTLSGLGGGTTVVSTNGFDASALIKNIGASPVYAAAVPIVDASQGFPVDPGGGTLAWPQGRPLYLVAPAGTTTVVIDPGNGDSSTTSPTELANAIIDAGLAQDIANQISLKGVPIIDNPTLLVDGVYGAGAGSGTFTYAATFGLPFYSEPLIDVSAFQSVDLAFVANIPAATTQSMGWQIQFFTDTAGTKAVGTFVGQMMASGSLSVSVPATGRYMSLTLAWSGGAISSGAPSFFLTISGSYRTVPGYVYSVKNDLWQNATTTTNPPWSDTATAKLIVPAGGNAQLFPSYTRAPLRLCAWITGVSANNSCSLNVTDLSGDYFGGFPSISTSSTFSTANIYCGSNQPRINITNNSATTPQNITLAMSFQ